MSSYHKSVLLEPALDLLQVREGKKYIDATLGGGGHTEGLLKLGGVVLGIDLDEEAISFVKTRLESYIKDSKLVLAKGNFADLDRLARLNGFEKVAGVLFDLGVSSHQIDTAQRGFSFLRNGPLDMRMDREAGVTAEYLVNLLGKGELYELFNRLGQDSSARAISNSIVRARRVRAIKTTDELLEAVKQAYGIQGELSPFVRNKIGQKAFQALRIAVNDELENLRLALPKALELLEKGGRLEVISFHSLEDKIVKDMFLKFEEENMGRVITRKVITATKEEMRDNSRAKSAKLRVFEKN